MFEVQLQTTAVEGGALAEQHCLTGLTIQVTNSPRLLFTTTMHTLWVLWQSYMQETTGFAETHKNALLQPLQECLFAEQHLQFAYLKTRQCVF